MRSLRNGTLVYVYQLALGVTLAVSTVLFIFWTWHWPLLGDASLIHYFCFLTDGGMAPYRVLSDMNMPGSFLVEWAVIHTYGGGSLAWRLFDLTLVAAATAAMISIARPTGWFAGLYAGLLFLPIHGADGLNDTGQRDLTMATLLVCSYAFLFLALRRGQVRALVAFGLCAGMAATIKPTVAPLCVLLLCIASVARHRRGQPWRWAAVAGAGGLLLPVLVSLVFLLRERALGAFLHGLRTVVPYYASLGHKPIGYLLLHSVSPVLPMVPLWLAVTWRVRNWRSYESLALGLGIGFGLASYVVQAKGFAYYRYPLLMILLLVAAIDLLGALNMPPRLAAGWLRLTAVLALGFGAFFLAPVATEKAHSFDWRDLQFIDALRADLTSLHAEQRQVQCIDSISGCGSVLYRMRLVQATGLLSDFLIFGPSSAVAVTEARRAYLTAAAAHPPRILIVTSKLHLVAQDRDYEKLAQWPAFQTDLQAHYTLVRTWQPTRLVHWWARLEPAAGYRIYLRTR